MNLEEKANTWAYTVSATLVEFNRAKLDFKQGANSLKSDLTEFIRANPKSTAEQILKHLEEI